MSCEGCGSASIDDYAIVGNMRTAALVSRRNASIDFMCYPYFDSPSLFCRLLDPRKGHFSICPHHSPDLNVKQFYYPLSNVLVTRFCDDQGIGQIIDLLPVIDEEGNVDGLPVLIRKVEVIRGNMTFKIEHEPAVNYGRDQPDKSPLQLKVVFSPSSPCSNHKSDDIPGECQLSDTCAAIFYMVDQTGGTTADYSFDRLCSMIENTNDYWRQWVKKCTYKGRWREMVLRSALALKLLTFIPTGAILAAATFSLPASFGGQDNWDYRFAWIRDSAFTLYAFIRIGLIDEAKAFMTWIERILKEAYEGGESGIRIMYGIHIHDKTKLRETFDERILEDFEGYRQSRPVRIGNAAAYQTQLDIYGEVMDSIYLCDKYFSRVSFDLWKSIRAMIVEPVLKGWNGKDHGIWELRGEPQHHVYSKVMCWVALDRAIRLALKHSLPGPVEDWRGVRDEIMESVMKDGWSRTRESFVQFYGSDQLDASNLIMPLVFFIGPNDPRMIKTINATLSPPSQGGLTLNKMAYRFLPAKDGDSDKQHEGAFSMCSFWLVEAMARAGHNDPEMLRKAVEMFEELLGYANHVGLYSEGIDVTGRATGNFPQAFTHFSLISAAHCLDRMLG